MPPPSRHYPSSPAFRAALAAAAPSSRARLLRPDTDAHAHDHEHAHAPPQLQVPLRFVATPAGGDCGFYAVAWGLQPATARPAVRAEGAAAVASPRDVRVALARHVCEHAADYKALLQRGRAATDDVVGATEEGDNYSSPNSNPNNSCNNSNNREENRAEDADGGEAARQFAASVLRGGPTGHWLGERWGDVEMLALARALRVRLELYAFDARRQSVRLYAAFDEGKRVVALLFSGRAEAGHFDLLRPQPSVWRHLRRLVSA